MCDTLVALSDSTRDGSVIFAKNSDREPDEAHVVQYISERQFLPDETVYTTHLEIPQVRQTFAVLLSKPFWIWGAEMGVNQWGVSIGNEALFEKTKVEKKPGLIGMDLIRLALERAASAEEAVRVITDLLEKYGQGGPAVYRHKGFTYHNAFLIADFKEAFVLETVNRDWAAKRISKGFNAISNCMSLGDDYDRASPGIRARGHVNLKKHFEGFLITHFSGAEKRRGRALELLEKNRGKLTPKGMAAILRDHGPFAGIKHPAEMSNACLCMHAADPLIRQSQTVGSLIVELKPDGRILSFATGTSAPCLSVFKPIFWGCSTNWRAESAFDPQSLWWQHEQLHRELLKCSARALLDFKNERDEFEAFIWKETEFVSEEPLEAQCRFADEVLQRSLKFEKNWLQRLQFVPRKSRFFYDKFWGRLSRRNGIPATPTESRQPEISVPQN